MGLSLEQVLAQAVDGGKVEVTMASNQDNGLVSYSFGELTFHAATAGAAPGSFRRPHLASEPGAPFKMFFSDRMRQVDPAPAQAAPGDQTFPQGPPRQPFDVDQTEAVGISITLGTVPGAAPVMTISLFNHKSTVTLAHQGDLLVGLGPSLGKSAASVFVVAFTGLGATPPH